MLRSSLAAGLGITIVLDTIAQLVWKAAALRLPPVGGMEDAVRAVLHQPFFLLLAIIFVLQLWVWLKVLEHADLSFAQPVTALSYVTVCGLSVVWFGESLDIRKAAGIGLVLLGVWFVSRGPAHHAPATESRP